MYKSPVTIYESANRSVGEIIGSVNQKKDKYIWECISKISVDVDKDELMKALAYDRDQYHKGYMDGAVDGIMQFFPEEPCNYNNMDEYADCDWCAEHCGIATVKECWQHAIEANWAGLHGDD